MNAAILANCINFYFFKKYNTRIGSFTFVIFFFSPCTKKCFKLVPLIWKWVHLIILLLKMDQLVPIFSRVEELIGKRLSKGISLEHICVEGPKEKRKKDRGTNSSIISFKNSLESFHFTWTCACRYIWTNSNSIIE